MARWETKVVVQRQCRNGRSPDRRLADNQCEIAVPIEVFCPNVCARIEQYDGATGLRIDAAHPIGLCQIACGTSERPIRLVVVAILGQRNDVFQMETITARSLWRLTVLTTPPGTLLDRRTQSGSVSSAFAAHNLAF